MESGLEAVMMLPAPAIIRALFLRLVNDIVLDFKGTDGYCWVCKIR